MKITLKAILFIVGITGISLSLSSFGTAKKAPIIKSTINTYRRLIIDTVPTKKVASSYTATDTSHNHTGNKVLAHPKKKPAKYSHTSRLDKVQK